MHSTILGITGILTLNGNISCWGRHPYSVFTLLPQICAWPNYPRSLSASVPASVCLCVCVRARACVNVWIMSVSNRLEAWELKAISFSTKLLYYCYPLPPGHAVSWDYAKLAVIFPEPCRSVLSASSQLTLLSEPALGRVRSGFGDSCVPVLGQEAGPISISSSESRWAGSHCPLCVLRPAWPFLLSVLPGLQLQEWLLPDFSGTALQRSRG